MKMKEKIMKETSGSFWKKINEAKKNGITGEEFSRIEELEGAIAGMEAKIDECKKEIKLIKKQASKRFNDTEKNDK
jgi:hypothetical protein